MLFVKRVDRSSKRMLSFVMKKEHTAHTLIDPSNAYQYLDEVSLYCGFPVWATSAVETARLKYQLGCAMKMSCQLIQMLSSQGTAVYPAVHSLP